MDPRPIGIFDSGLGGLTAAKALEEILPGESLVYFGDSVNAPYGTRSREELFALASANRDFLLGFDVKAFVVACGTVSSTVLGEVRKTCPVPMFDVVGAACGTAAEAGARRVAVAATEATVRAGAFERRLKELSPDMEVFSKACQSLVATVERGHFCAGDPVAEAAVAAELAPIRDYAPDTLILACTHFPLLEQSIAAYLGPQVKLLSVGAETARALEGYLRENGLLSGRTRGVHRWFTSGSVAEFAEFAEIFLGHKVIPERHVNFVV